MKEKKPNTRSPDTADWMVTRRTFLKGSGFIIAGLATGVPFARAISMDDKAKLTFGIVTDANIPPKQLNWFKKDLASSKKRVITFVHHAGYYSIIEGIHYYTLKGMVEGGGVKNNSYAIVEVYDDNSIVVTGYRKALSKEMNKA